MQEAARSSRRSARAASSPSSAWPGRTAQAEYFRGEVEGTLVWPPRGDKGFGYDPVFLPDGHDRTFGEMTAEEKHGWKPGQAEALSHRARAFQKFAQACLGVGMNGPCCRPADPGFGVYVHWPFCAAKCPYCDFNCHVRHQPVDQERFARAFAAETRDDARSAPARATVTSIFLGGGTPSLMKPRNRRRGARRGGGELDACRTASR